MVIEVVEKGYMLNDRVLRHAKVVVSATPSEHSGESQRADTTTDQSNPSPQQEN
jgi:hypothetical protein